MARKKKDAEVEEVGEQLDLIDVAPENAGPIIDGFEISVTPRDELVKVKDKTEE